MTWAWTPALTSGQKLDLILTTVRAMRDDVRAILAMEKMQMATLADVQAAASAQTTVVASVEALLVKVSGMLAEALAAQDPVAIQAVVDLINDNTASLSASVVENTPAAVPPTP